MILLVFIYGNEDLGLRAAEKTKLSYLSQSFRVAFPFIEEETCFDYDDNDV